MREEISSPVRANELEAFKQGPPNEVQCPVLGDCRSWAHFLNKPHQRPLAEVRAVPIRRDDEVRIVPQAQQCSDMRAFWLWQTPRRGHYNDREGKVTQVYRKKFRAPSQLAEFTGEVKGKVSLFWALSAFPRKV